MDYSIKEYTLKNDTNIGLNLEYIRDRKLKLFLHLVLKNGDWNKSSLEKSVQRNQDK